MSGGIEFIIAVDQHNVRNRNGRDDDQNYANDDQFNEGESSFMSSQGRCTGFFVLIIEGHNVFQLTAERSTPAVAQDERPFKFRSESLEVKGDGGTKRASTAPTLVMSKWPFTCAIRPFSGRQTQSLMNAAGYDMPTSVGRFDRWPVAMCKLIFSNLGKKILGKAAGDLTQRNLILSCTTGMQLARRSASYWFWMAVIDIAVSIQRPLTSCQIETTRRPEDGNCAPAAA